MSTFAAIDFETANFRPDSACAVGLVVVQGHDIVRREHHLIRPPDQQFSFTHIHGLTWDDVREAPTFAELWPLLREVLAEADFLAAHNASFERRVMESCCRTSGLTQPAQPYVCTVKVARSVWRIFPTKLPDVCRHLGIALTHHQADSDAEACARIVMAAQEAGWRREGAPPRRSIAAGSAARPTEYA
jgi:DNA polymerase III subunit epsilon